jgi:hypothetical protein
VSGWNSEKVEYERRGREKEREKYSKIVYFYSKKKFLGAIFSLSLAFCFITWAVKLDQIRVFAESGLRFCVVDNFIIDYFKA